jgi:hypothetical protein
MKLADESVETVIRVLGKCSSELEPVGPWRWQCVVQNGTRMPLAASVEDGFLQLVGRPQANRGTSGSIETALLGNDKLVGGVKFALNAASSGLRLQTEIALVNESQVLHRFHWALAGFHQGYHRLKSLEFSDGATAVSSACAAAVSIPELLRETSWACTERGPNDFAVDLGTDSAPSARISTNEHGIDFSVEVVRCAPAAEATRLALAVFLLTASGALRLARAHAIEDGDQQRFGFQVCLPPAPTTDELDHALAALSTAYRMCTREVNLLLDDAAAQCYLGVRDIPCTTNPENEKEI